MSVLQKRRRIPPAVKQAAVLLAPLETSTGDGAHAHLLRVQHYEGMLGDGTITMKFVTARLGTAVG